MQNDIANLWLLPDGVQDLLSSEAQKQEKLRFEFTNQLMAQGYELICPPMIEFTESLLGNASEDVKRQTFKIIDQITGRLMGVRADITPQILRIDAQLNKNRPNHHIARYCYAGHVIHTLPDGLFGSRTPLQLGAEIFGCASIDADIELIDVLYGLMQSVGVSDKLHLDIGHVQLFRRLKTLAKLTDHDAEAIVALYANKALPELRALCQNLATCDDMKHDFLTLAQHGHDLEALSANLSAMALDDNEVQTAIAELELMMQYVRGLGGQVSLDVTGLGYHYHTGLVFNGYVLGENQPIVRGGRFAGDTSFDVATQTPHASPKPSMRPATGFSLDITRLQSLLSLANDAEQEFVVVDFDAMQNLGQTQTQKLHDKIAQLHTQGKRVIKPLTPNDGTDKMTHRLVMENGEWVVNKA